MVNAYIKFEVIDGLPLKRTKDPWILLSELEELGATVNDKSYDIYESTYFGKNRKKFIVRYNCTIKMNHLEMFTKELEKRHSNGTELWRTINIIL